MSLAVCSKKFGKWSPLVEQHPKLNVVIANGNRSQALVKLLTGEPEVGTRISVA